MNKTKIEWCDSTLNPVTGCTYGCDFCYARKMNNRFKWVEDFKYPEFFQERLIKLDSKTSNNIFMDSMSDIADWKPMWFMTTFSSMKVNPQHNYLFLSKRPHIYDKWLQFGWSNVWCGASGMGTQSANEALFYLDNVSAYNTFLSIEPLLNEVQFAESIKNIKWVIIGAETGNRKNKVTPKVEWIRSITEQCDLYNIPVFMKNSLAPIISEENMRRNFPQGLLKEVY